jgi:sigma-B regulation protein RsbU (phosphoserine phosphatase)
VRAVAMPESSSPTYAVVVDILLDAHVRRQLRDTTGVEVENVQLVNTDVEVLPGRPEPGPAPGDAAPRFTSIAYLPSRNWTDGTASFMTASVRLGIGDMYRRISAAPAQVGSANIVLYILAVVGGLFLIIEIVALATGLVLARSITGSVHALATGTERVRQGDFSYKIAVAADDQLGELAQSFNSMTASIEDLLREAAEKKRLEEELRIAHEIQMSLLPQHPPRIPGLAMSALCVPAREVGGDYYDLISLDEHRLGVLIADVSGKGTSAALYMAELKGLVLSLSRSHTSPRALLIEANRTLANELDARSFITITYGVIDMRARTLTYARAGHTPLIHVPGHLDGSVEKARVLVPNGLVLGLKIDDGQLFERLLEEQTIALGSGDLLVFFTDGITEAMNGAEDFFGEQRLSQIIEEHSHLPPDELRERILREVEAFVGDAPQHDDMTMILLKVEAPG